MAYPGAPMAPLYPYPANHSRRHDFLMPGSAPMLGGLNRPAQTNIGAGGVNASPMLPAAPRFNYNDDYDNGPLERGAAARHIAGVPFYNGQQQQQTAPQFSAPAAPLPRLQDTFGLRQNLNRKIAVGDEYGAAQLAPYVPMAPNFLQQDRLTNNADARANEMNTAVAGMYSGQGNLSNAAAAGTPGLMSSQGAVNNSQAAMNYAQAPFVGPAMQAQTQATTAGAQFPQEERTRLHSENQQLRTQLQQMQTQLAKLGQAGAKPAPQPRNVGLTQSDVEAARDIGYGGVAAVRQGIPPGSPTTQPSVQAAPQQPQQQPAAPTTQPAGAGLETADRAFSASQNRYYRKVNGQWIPE